AGEEAFEIEHPVWPAGVIYGQVLDADGVPLGGARPSMKTLEHPEGRPRPDPNWWHNRPADQEGNFVISPVPLGGVYRPEFAHPTLKTRVFFDPVEVTAAQSRREIAVTMPRGERVVARLVDEDGSPIPGVGVSLSYDKEHGGHGWSGLSSDIRGEVTFEGVNFDLPVQYALETEPDRGFEPQHLKIDGPGRHRIVLTPGLTIRGRIVEDASGAPVGKREIRLFSGKTDDYYPTTTLEDGSFTLDAMSLGTHYIWISGGNAVEDPIEITDADAILEIRMK
ncbi:MAG: hypothetical protein AAF357_11345, partial [Verrucomicrobiota bacterium]